MSRPGGARPSAEPERPSRATDPSVELLLADLVSDMRAAVGSKLVGVYLYGSAVSGGFEPGISDVDLVVVLADEPTPADLAALDRMHRRFVERHSDWDDRVDAIYVSAKSLSAPGGSAGRLAVVSPGEPFHVTVADGKWLMNWYLVRETGRTLHGPDPRTIIAPITAARFVANVQEHVREWRTWIDGMHGRRAYAYAILTLCRALYSYRTGLSASKSEAATWTGAELPEWSDLIGDALRWRLASEADEGDDGDGDDHAAGAMTHAFVAHVIGLIL